MKKLIEKTHKGATFIEYAMLAGLVAVVVAVAALFFGDQLKALFSDTGKQTQKVDQAVKSANITPNVEAIDGGSESK